MNVLQAESDSSSDSDSDSEVPSADICDKLCQEFSMITCTDSALAMMYLQKNSWNLQKALEKYFQATGSMNPNVAIEEPNHSEQNISTPNCNQTTFSTLTDNNATDVSEVAGLAARDDNPFRIKILSWNIDGLDLNNLETRTRAACKVIINNNPDIVFLQEVVTTTSEIIKQTLKEYLVIDGGTSGYFTMILLNRSTVMHESHQATPFYSSKMARNLLHSEVNIKGIPFMVITSHLESTGSHKDERLRQTKMCFETMKAASNTRVVIFGGDLNARDKELCTISIPDDVIDIWQFCGSREIAKYTWDTRRNDNLEMAGRFKPRCRFDRLFIRNDSKKSVRPVYFELVGLDRLPSCRRYASDHWGILAHLNINC